jgi:hypothetical protein
MPRDHSTESTENEQPGSGDRESPPLPPTDSRPTCIESGCGALVTDTEEIIVGDPESEDPATDTLVSCEAGHDALVSAWR